MVYVTKWDARREPYRREKILRTLKRIGAPKDVAEKVVLGIEAKIYDGIHTREILDMVFRGLEERMPTVSLMKDLKTAIAEMRPAPDFEEYVRRVLRAHGYNVAPNKVIQGFCVTHEIDGVVEKDGKKIYLEVKHHSAPHIRTPFWVTLAAKAKWDDIRKGFEEGLNSHPFDQILIVCNTRLTTHAKRYADCQGLDHLGWDRPEGRGLKSLITEKKLYLITILRDISSNERDILADAGILTLDELVKGELPEDDIPRQRLRELREMSKQALNR